MPLIRKSLGILQYQANLFTNRLLTMPFLILNITTDCNSRCKMCDFWRSRNKDVLCVTEIKSIVDSAKRLNLRKIVISGGEPLVHPDFTALAGMLGETKLKLSLATNGIILEKYAPEVAKFFSTVFVSLDGSCPEIYKKVRGVEALAAVTAGVKKLKSLNPSILVIGRNVIQKSNYPDLLSIIKTAKEMGMDHISFSAADINYAAFGRASSIENEIAQDILLDDNDLLRFKEIIVGLKKNNFELFSSRFIIEGFKNLIKIRNFYKALRGSAEFPAVYCNLPWLSAVVDADGQVKPCCLHKEFGNIRQIPLETIVNALPMVEFRKSLKQQRGPLCSRCVYSSAKVHLKMLYEMF